MRYVAFEVVRYGVVVEDERIWEYCKLSDVQNEVTLFPTVFVYSMIRDTHCLKKVYVYAF